MSVCYVDLDGEFISQREYCRRLGYKYSSICTYIGKNKVSFTEAVNHYLAIHPMELNGKRLTKKEYCRELGYSYSAICWIAKYHKIPFEEAIEEYLKPRFERKWAKRVAKNKLLYRIWYDMKNRCYNPKATGYEYYGGAGIIVCDRWSDYFKFEEDMYESYIEHVEKYGEKDTTIDRYPNKLGNYEPSNVRWATQEEQANNKTTNRIIIDGLNLAQFCSKYNLEYGTTLGRLNRGWTVDEILNPILCDKNRRIIAPTGETTKELATRLGISESAIRHRYERNWTWQEILETPLGQHRKNK